MIELTYIVPVYFNEKSTDLIHRVLSTYSKYADTVLERVQFIIVDDASPLRVDIDERYNLNILLLRVRDDISWNQPGARNLGVLYARSEKLILTDIDHLIPEWTFKSLLNDNIPQNELHLFIRLDENKKFVATHPNIIFISRSQFLKVKGYDEDFCGSYGYDDMFFLDCQRKIGANIKTRDLKDTIMSIKAVGYLENTHTLERETGKNKKLYKKKQARSDLFLNFTWDIAADLSMK